MLACGASPARTPAPVPPPAAPPAPVVHHLDDPDVNRPHDKLLSIDWSVQRDPRDLWKLIAPSGVDWEARLEEVPDTVTDGLATSLLTGGNFTCATPAQACGNVPGDVPPPAPTAGLDDPCLRRLLALWSLAQLEPDQLPKDALRAIAALPPPESQLVANAIRMVPESEQDFRLELLAIAWQAGQRDVVAGIVPDLDEDHVAAALAKHHIDAALESLTADRHRAEFLAAIADDKLGATARNQAMIEVAALDTTTTGKDVLAPDLQKALISATHSKDCAVVAAAAHMFEARGDHRFGPKRPRARKVEPLMHALCVLAHYEEIQRADEPSYLPGYVPASGMDLTRITYDEYADPHTTETTEHVARDQVVLPELEDMLRALDHCTGSVCTSEEHEFRFDWKPGPGGDLLLARITVVERPSCGMLKP